MSDEYVHFNNNTQPAINEDNLNRMQQLIKQDINGVVSGDTLPLGAMIQFPGGTIPDNYLLCDGSAVSRTTYALLFNVIGTTYGPGDGSTTFNLPDMRSRTLATNYIIKAFQSAGVIASIVNARNTSTTNAYSCGYINDNYYSVTELYNNTSGSTGSIILSDSVSNYSYIEIFYGADGFEYSTKVRAGQSFATGAQSVFSGSSNIALYTSNWTMSGTNITFAKASNKYIGDSVSSYGTNPYVKIYKVLGYK